MTLHHVIDGDDDAPPLVLSPSLGSTLAMWDPQVPALARTHRVIRYDHRGHGGSPVPPAPYALEDLGADVLALLDTLEIERVDWCGLSLGGMVGMWLAAHAPERIGRLALCCTSAQLGPRSTWEERITAIRAGGTDAIADAGVSRWLTADFAAAHPDVAARLRAMIAGTDDEGYIGCSAAIEQMDLRGVLGDIRAPTLVIAGADDPSTPPEPHGERIVAGIPGARLEVVADAAHLANVQQPEAVTRLLLEHFDLAPFDALIGTWATEATHPAFDGVVSGSATFEWVEGGHFVIQRVRNDDPLFPASISVIGAPEDGDGLVMEYFDSRGVRRTYGASAAGGILRFWRDAPGFDQRFSATPAPDGFEGRWQLARSPGDWRDDVRVVYRRA
jgi:3-oxoadipate enol-lactonase